MIFGFSFEKKLKRKGYKVIIGVDEVGRGPLAGPVTACAVMYAIGKRQETIRRLRDSKKLTRKQRDEFYRAFLSESALRWAVASVSPAVIDRINIFEATKLASKRAVLKLEKEIGERADFLILDGNTKLALPHEQLPIIKGDEKIASCAIASIIAKVTRDTMMERYHKRYREYRFDLHKGYGTKLHFAMLQTYGPSPIHRMSFNLTR